MPPQNMVNILAVFKSALILVIFLPIGIRKMFTGDAETNLDVLKDILGDIFKMRETATFINTR